MVALSCAIKYSLRIQAIHPVIKVSFGGQRSDLVQFRLEVLFPGSLLTLIFRPVLTVEMFGL